MKTCGYCGRENEDESVFCRECGLSEFVVPPAAKAPEPQEYATDEAKPEGPPAEVSPDQEAAICPFCLFLNLPEREWCKQCGAPFNTSVMGPFESAVAAGFIWRGAVRGHPKRFVLFVVWAMFFPFCCVNSVAVVGALFLGNMLMLIFCLFYAAIPFSILYQVTRNYLTIPEVKLDE